MQTTEPETFKPIDHYKANMTLVDEIALRIYINRVSGISFEESARSAYIQAEAFVKVKNNQ